MAPPMPTSPVALTVRKALEEKSIYLVTDIEYVSHVCLSRAGR